MDISPLATLRAQQPSLNVGFQTFQCEWIADDFKFCPTFEIFIAHCRKTIASLLMIFVKFQNFSLRQVKYVVLHTFFATPRWASQASNNTFQSTRTFEIERKVETVLSQL